MKITGCRPTTFRKIPDRSSRIAPRRRTLACCCSQLSRRTILATLAWLNWSSVWKKRSPSHAKAAKVSRSFAQLVRHENAAAFVAAIRFDSRQRKSGRHVCSRSNKRVWKFPMISFWVAGFEWVMRHAGRACARRCRNSRRPRQRTDAISIKQLMQEVGRVRGAVGADRAAESGRVAATSRARQRTGGDDRRHGRGRCRTCIQSGEVEELHWWSSALLQAIR